MTIIEKEWTKPINLRKRNVTNKIVLHHSDASSCTVDDINRWHVAKQYACLGYHLFVSKKGEVFRGRPIFTIGAHALGVNGESIGICCEGDYMTETMPDIQKKALVEAIQYVLNLYPNCEIVGHNEVTPTACPGINFPMKEVKEMLNDNEVFVDVPDAHWAKAEIKELKQMGVIIGNQYNEFKPDEPATRAEVVKMVRNAIRYITGK